MVKGHKKKLGDILVTAGKITPYQLQNALRTQKVIGKKLGTVLIESGIVTEEDIIEAVEEQTGIEKFRFK